MNYNQHLNETLGVEFNWEQYITSIVMSNAASLKSAILDDVVTDVKADILLQCQKGEVLEKHIIKAKESSGDPLGNVKGVLCQAVKYRTSCARRKVGRHKTARFSEIKDLDLADREHFDYSDFEISIAAELKKMIVESTTKKIADRRKLALALLPDKLAGFTYSQIKAKWNIKSITKMYRIFDDIKEATLRCGIVPYMNVRTLKAQ